MLERRAVPERAGLAGENRHVVPRIEHRLVAPEAAAMLPDGPAVLSQVDAVGIGTDFDRSANSVGSDRIPVVVEPHEAGPGDRRRHGMEPVEATRISDKAGTFRLKHFPDRPVTQFDFPEVHGRCDLAVVDAGVKLVLPHFPCWSSLRSM